MSNWFKLNSVRLDQGTTATLDDGEPHLADAMDCLKELVCEDQVLTAHITVTALTASGVRRHELVLDNENAKLHKTALQTSGDIVENSELYRQITTHGGTATMCDGDTLTIWLGEVLNENTLVVKSPDIHEVMDNDISKLW